MAGPQRFGEAAGAATEWDPVEVEGLAAVIRVASDAQVSRVLLQSIDGREFQNQADVEGAVASADAVLSAIRDIDREALPSYSLNLSVPPDSLVGFCRELDVRGVDSELLARIDLPAFDPDVLQQGLVATIQGGSGAELLPVIRVMEHIQATAAWQSVHDTLFDRLREGWSVEGPESVDLLLVAKALARVHAQARESLRSLVREGYALHYIHHSQSAGAAAVATWLVEPVGRQNLMRPTDTHDANLLAPACCRLAGSASAAPACVPPESRAPMTDAAASRFGAGRTHQAPASDAVR